MKLQFDPNQQFQLDAVAAVADLFDGQPQGVPEYSVIRSSSDGLLAGLQRTELGAGTRLLVDEERLRHNTRRIQAQNDIENSDEAAALEAWDIADGPAGVTRACPHFSVEMETGTGKTYVYLRTVFELAHRYGFRKFIIVVPSVAIREGVLKNIAITADHFRSLYNNMPMEHFVYDPKKVNRLRQFATSNTLQILVINIDSFRKNFTGTEAERRSNVIYKESDQLSGHQPIEFVQAARPIVIIDEPQSVDSTDKAQEAIKALNPLCTLRYSATHKNRYNLVYRLDPVRAFELRLVKQIVVASVTAEGAQNDAFVRVEAIDNKKGIKAKLRIHAQGAAGPIEKTVTVKTGGDLFALSQSRHLYAQGFTVTEISAEPGNEYVRFGSGLTLGLGQERGGAQADVWRAQIRHTLKRHLEKELQLQGQGIKVLSLFFVDRVANYRDYNAEGHAVQGKFAAALEEEIVALAADPRYAQLDSVKLPVAKVHNGYFAQDKKGALKDTRGDTQADDDVYDLIMKDKERLLSLSEPLRFIFSHSALREGWDNPNVFQICTLNESKSAMKKRQEIGRGLRLPVDQNGVRVFDESINKLYVMANESYEEFARALQTEYEEDCGVAFGKVPLTALAKIVRVVDGVATPIGREQAEKLLAALVADGALMSDGRISERFDPSRPGFALHLPAEFEDLASSALDLLASHRIERHIARERDEQVSRLKKEVLLTPEFQELWSRIKPRTTYRVEYASDTLVSRAAEAVRQMAPIEQPRLRVVAGSLAVQRGGVNTSAVSASDEALAPGRTAVPDVLAYLQAETELTRATLSRILTESGRLSEFFVNPQRFMDAVAAIIRHELHRLVVDGIKYERVDGPEGEWEMALFKSEELVNYLSAMSVRKSVYDHVVYDSEVERTFAQRLDERDDIKLFVKLPGWFEVDTPVGKYNPDWAIVKHDDATLYLVRETKGTRDFLKLRTSEADKVRCGARHFEALGVDYAVRVGADEV